MLTERCIVRIIVDDGPVCEVISLSNARQALSRPDDVLYGLEVKDYSPGRADIERGERYPLVAERIREKAR